MSDLFQPWTLGEVPFRNRLFVAPMCQYSTEDGFPNDWDCRHAGQADCPVQYERAAR